ncbi:MAG TPA: ABC transporter ATP-binding protein [Opitutaceae bacterium]|nr:ABC transporter ATP-binding protein [Opitutaceae bacterium]
MSEGVSTQAVLRAHALRKGFRSGDRRIEVLLGVDLAIAPGESVAVRGESGAGKSTLLNLLAGLDAPDSGELFWGDQGVTPANATARRNRYLGMVFQSFYLIPELNALENVLMPRRIGGKVDAEARRRATALLGEVGLAERIHHLPSQLSGGERQRVAVARALINAPPLLLADEPTGNLDERTGDAVIDLLLSLCRSTGTALILVTHNIAHAAKTGRVLMLRGGQLHHV